MTQSGDWSTGRPCKPRILKKHQWIHSVVQPWNGHEPTELLRCSNDNPLHCLNHNPHRRISSEKWCLKLQPSEKRSELSWVNLKRQIVPGLTFWDNGFSGIQSGKAINCLKIGTVNQGYELSVIDGNDCFALPPVNCVVEQGFGAPDILKALGDQR